MKQNRLILNGGGVCDVNKIPSQVLLHLRLRRTTCLNYYFVTISDAAVN